MIVTPLCWLLAGFILLVGVVTLLSLHYLGQPRKRRRRR